MCKHSKVQELMKTKLNSAFLIAGVFLLIIAVFLGTGQVKDPPIVSTPDLSNHPIYSEYDFGQEDNVIDVGIQPLWIPANTIVEALKRDAVLKKAMSEQGLQIRFHPFLKGVDMNFFLKRGDLEVGISGDMPVLTAAADFNVLVAALIQQGFSSIVAKKHMLMKELRGKRIGYAFGSNAHYTLLQALSSANLRETDVRLVLLEVNEMPDALAQGKVDAFSAWEPTPTIASTRYKNQVVIHRSMTSGYLYFSRSFADKYPEAVRQIVASQVRSMAWIKESRKNLFDASRWTLQAGMDFSGQKTVLSVEQAVDLAMSDILGITSVPFIPKNYLIQNGPLHREFEFLKTLGKIPSSSNWERVRDNFDHQILMEVLTNPQKYRLDEFKIDGGNNE